MSPIPLVEVFASVQGEGFHSGRPAIFVRFAGCPLACEFAPGVVCDTPYMKANLKPSLDELFDGMRDLAMKPDRSVPVDKRTMLILTGGEPTASPHFDDVVRRALEQGYYVAIETNGTRWREGLQWVHWISISPKDTVPQTSRAEFHNHNPRSAELDQAVIEEAKDRSYAFTINGAEYRHVVAGPDEPTPVYRPATAHFVSPAVKSDGAGKEWETGFPGFVNGAVAACLRIVQLDPRWRLSLQSHKFLGVR